MTPQEFKEIRLKLGLSIESLAKKLGYSLRHVRCLESGAKPIVEKSEEKIKESYPVFLWKKLFEDIVEKKNVEDPYKLLYRISKVKDINKLAELVPNPYKKLELDSFFSKDVLDMKWIPKIRRKRKGEVDSVDYNKKFDSLKNL